MKGVNIQHTYCTCLPGYLVIVNVIITTTFGIFNFNKSVRVQREKHTSLTQSFLSFKTQKLMTWINIDEIWTVIHAFRQNNGFPFDACLVCFFVYLVYWQIHKSRWKDTSWFDFDLRLSPFCSISFLLMLISTRWMRCENWCCCHLTLLKNSQTWREEEALIANITKHTYARVCMHCQSVRCSNKWE